MKTKFIKIKCMAKNCKVQIIIEVNKVIIDNKEQYESKEMEWQPFLGLFFGGHLCLIFNGG